MADTSPKFTACVTTGSNISNIEIKNGQLIFIKDKQEIAFDFNDKRIYYKDIIILNSEIDRTSLLAPITNKFYYVEETYVLWRYLATGWIQITMPPQDIFFIGEELPSSGVVNKLYINTTEKNISIWSEDSYLTVSDKTNEIPVSTLQELFKIN